jgi:cysteine synthase
MPMSQPEHFMHYAMSCALADPDAYYCNQFDNLANMRAHYNGTRGCWPMVKARSGLLTVSRRGALCCVIRITV